MKEYEQQIDDLINSGDVNNWRLALELCRGLIEDAELVIGTKCHGKIGSNGLGHPYDWSKFLIVDCNCTWSTDEYGRFVIVKHVPTGNKLRSDYKFTI